MSLPVCEGLRPVISVGAVFGLLPLKWKSHGGSDTAIQGTFIKWPLLVPYRLYTLSANLIIFSFAVVIFFRDLSSNEANLVEQFLDMVYHCHILITIFACFIQSRNIPEILQQWIHVESLFKSYQKDFSNHKTFILLLRNRNKVLPFKSLEVSRSVQRVQPLKRNGVETRFEDVLHFSVRNVHSIFIWKCRLITGIYVLSVFLGAVSYFVSVSIKEKSKSFSDYLQSVSEIYVIDEACTSWTGFYVLFVGHAMELIWAYGDMLILCTSFVLRYQFQRFERVAMETCSGVVDPRDLENLRMVHWALAKVTKKTIGMLGLLTTTVFICNILYLFSRVYTGLEEDLSHPHWFIRFEAAYAFSYLIIRIFATAIFATKLSSDSMKSFQFITRSPSYSHSELHYLLLERLSTQVLSSNIAMSGNGYFYVNQGFIATLVSALVTYEVVILQFSAASRSTTT